MSWQVYVDMCFKDKNQTKVTGIVDQAAIFSAAGDSVWGTSPGFAIAPAEVTKIAASFNDTSDPKTITMTGVKIGNEKYMAVQSDGEALVCRKGRQGLLCLKTKQAIVVAHHPEGVQIGELWAQALYTADYLQKMGY